LQGRGEQNESPFNVFVLHPSRQSRPRDTKLSAACTRFAAAAAVFRGRPVTKLPPRLSRSPVSCRQTKPSREHADTVNGQDDIAPTRADSITVRPDTAPGGRRRSFAMLHAPGSGIVEVLDCRCVATMPH